MEIINADSSMIERRNSGVYKRKFPFCTSQCNPLGELLQCYSADCICPILNSTDPSSIITCANCLESANTTLGGSITLLSQRCSQNVRRHALGLSPKLFKAQVNASTSIVLANSSTCSVQLTSLLVRAVSIQSIRKTPSHWSNWHNNVGLYLLQRQQVLLPLSRTYVAG